MKHELTAAALCAVLLAGCEAGQSFQPGEPASSEPAPQAAPEPPAEAAALSPSHSGPVTWVRDGDTIEVAGVAVRLDGLHCPEYDASGGGAATCAMRRLVAGKTVACMLTGEVTYDREVGRCAAGGVDLAASLIREGYCARFPRYDPAGRYVEAQATAGGWGGPLPGYCY